MDHRYYRVILNWEDLQDNNQKKTGNNLPSLDSPRSQELLGQKLPGQKPLSQKLLGQKLLEQKFAMDCGIIIIKIGSSLLLDDYGAVNKDFLANLGEDILFLQAMGKRVILVSSGSVALGRGIFFNHILSKQQLAEGKNSQHIQHSQRSQNLANNNARRMRLEEKQAASACGQVALINAYTEIFGIKNIRIAQILITASDFDMRKTYLNINSTLNTLLASGIVPIINENDTTATEELRMGENDGLAARVASMCEASLMFLLSDVDGLYDKNPNIHKDARHIPVVKKITKNIKATAGGSHSVFGSGGMGSKIAAIEIAFLGGCSTIITRGVDGDKLPISPLLKGHKQFSIFVADSSNIHNKKRRWLAGRYKAKGKIFIDKGAEKALLAGGSLLPVGVKQIEGNFLRGDVVAICLMATGGKIATGLVEYSSAEAEKIIGKTSDEIIPILGYQARSFLIHRDNMMLN